MRSVILSRIAMAAVPASLFLICLSASAQTPLLLVGGYAHGAANIRALAELGLGNFVWIPKSNLIEDGNTPWDDQNDLVSDAQACIQAGFSFMVSQGRGLGEKIRPGGYDYGGDCTPESHGAAELRKISKLAGPLFVGLHAEELDADFIQSAIRPGYRSRTPDIYQFTDRAGGRKSFEHELVKLKKRYKGYAPHAGFWPNLCVTYHHSGFRIGADLVMAELLESLPAVELQLAYLRGGAKQFRRHWGVWVSPWLQGKVPCEDSRLWPAGYCSKNGGHSASALKRSLYLSYVAGARTLAVQQSEPLFSYRNRERPEFGYKLASWGRELKQFWDYVRNHTEPVNPLTTLAVLVDADSGWAPANLWGGWSQKETVWGKLAADTADSMLSGFLEVLLPGLNRTEQSAREGAVYPGSFVSTPFGPVDIVSSDVDEAGLRGYRAVLVLGGLQMNSRLLGVLKNYVRGGGRLYINVCQMRLNEAFVQAPEFLGARIGGSTIRAVWTSRLIDGTRVFSSSRIVLRRELPGIKQTEFSEPWFCSQDVGLCGAEVAADDGNGNPVLLCNRYGKGEVWLSTPEYMMEGYGSQTAVLGFFKALTESLCRDSLVSVSAAETCEPAPDISWSASRQGQDVLIVIANHGSSARKVSVVVRRPCERVDVEMGPAAAAVFDGGGSRADITIGPEDAVLLRARSVTAVDEGG